MSLEELASKGKRVRDARAARRVRAPWWQRLKEPKSHKLRGDALAGSRQVAVLVGQVLLFAALCGLAYLLLEHAGGAPWSELGAAAVGSAALVPLILLGRHLRQRLAERELARLARLPFAGNWGHYAAQLGKGRTTTRVTIQARFATPLEAERAQVAADAMLGLLEQGATTKGTEVLCLQSGELETWNLGAETSGDHSNHRVHAWTKVALSALLRLHAQHPLASVHIQLEP